MILRRNNHNHHNNTTQPPHSPGGDIIVSDVGLRAVTVEDDRKQSSTSCRSDDRRRCCWGCDNWFSWVFLFVTCRVPVHEHVPVVHVQNQRQSYRRYTTYINSNFFVISILIFFMMTASTCTYFSSTSSKNQITIPVQEEESEVEMITSLNLLVPKGKTIIETETPSCVKSLLKHKKAIITDVQIGTPNNTGSPKESISFRILLHPPEIDKYITHKIQSKGSYEPEMEHFISLAWSNSDSNSNSNSNSNHPPLSNSSSCPSSSSSSFWAVDIGANIGFHSLHMAQRGANVISFEPAPDTATLLKCSAELLSFGDTTTTTSSTKKLGGSITIIEAGASNVESQATMLRHPDSPGMTTFGTNLTFPLKQILENDQTRNNRDNNSNTSNPTMMKLIRAQDVLISHGVPEGHSECLRLLKVDAEGYELHALQGLNLTKFPFYYLTFEFFPMMLKASGSDPVDLLMLVRDAGYKCDCDVYAGRTRDEMYAWSNGIKKHINVFCHLSDVIDS